MSEKTAPLIFNILFRFIRQIMSGRKKSKTNMKTYLKYIEECLEKGVDAIKLQPNDSRVDCDLRTRAMYEFALHEKEEDIDAKKAKKFTKAAKKAKRQGKILSALRSAMLEAARGNVHEYCTATRVVEKLLKKHKRKMLARKNKQKVLAQAS
jgi:hypothetical protein